jgi:hypothetical protein
MSSLTLRTLPTLLTDCVLVGHARKADVVFTPRQWFAMCAHMMNENPANFFLMPYRKDGKAKFAKAFHAKVDERVQWAWDTITGREKSPGSVGFYPTNAQRKSRWAAMDFDMHDDDRMRARDLALKAFAIFYRQPQLYVALTTSAGDPTHSGWHLFIFTAEFFPCEEWTRLLRQVADQIGAPVKPGVCEIFPDDCKGIGRGIRAPGSWNPKSGECGLICHETLTRLLLPSLPEVTPKESICSLDARCSTWEEKQITPSSESPLGVTPSSKLFRGEHGQWANQFAITAPSTRHDKLLKLVGAAFLQSGREVARQNAELQHGESSPSPAATLTEHMIEFDRMWSGLERKWLRTLSPSEKDKFDSLTTDNERATFRILRNWSQTDSPDFKAHCESLGNRLGVTLKTAANIRRHFCSLGILRQTKPYTPHKFAARYKWIASNEAKRRQAALVSPQWNGDPGDARLKRVSK